MIGTEDILGWLTEEDEGVLEGLWRQADDTRRSCVGDEVHLRGLVEISNYCVRQCHYCGIRAGNAGLTRYRMSAAEVVDCARAAVQFGYGTVVLQSGEDPGITGRWVCEVIESIKRETDLAVTLSLGERTIDELAAWKEAGADRYLLRFETSNPELFSIIHPAAPGRPPVDRLALLEELHRLGYEAGSGVMIGIPGQTYRDLAADIALFRSLELEMIGVGPYIPHPGTPMASMRRADGEGPGAQVPNTELMTYKTLALTRLVCPQSNIPSTTALATLNLEEGRELGLMRGANVVMPNLTPPEYRIHYEIYPAKACVRETADQCNSCLRRRIESIGRKVGKGPGSARR
jgi:biotin synthase